VTADLAGILALAFYAAIAAFVVLRAIRRSGESWQTWVLMLIAKSYAGLFFQLRVRQPPPIPFGGALVLVNHRSPVDPLLVVAASAGNPFQGRLNVTEFLTAIEYTQIGGAIGFICRHMHTIPVHRHGKDMESAKIALRRIQAGKTVGIFPEGRINFGEGLLPAIPGVAWLALKAERPVIPVFITGAPQHPGRSMVGPFLMPRKVRIDFGPPVDLSRYSGQRPTPALLAEVTTLLMQKLAETGGIESLPQRPVLSGSRASA
jgi:1-acyl-sn-glycerol-3-phosphate acyltransferase